MKIVYITAGASGMYCGSCLRDNTLVRTLRAQGCDIVLLPLYTPIKTDEEDASEDRVFVGGINSFLQQKVPFMRKVPAFLDRWLNRPGVIRKLVGGNMEIEAAQLGEMTLSMLRGENGAQQKELDQLVRWLKSDGKPDVLHLTNLLIGGIVSQVKRDLGVPVIVTLQGDDLFLDELIEPYKTDVLEEMQRIARQVDGFVVNSEFYAKKMSRILDVPVEKMQIVPLSIDLADFEDLPYRPKREDGVVVGYFARVSPEKGFGLLVDAFIDLRQRGGFEHVTLRAGGWLGAADREFYDVCLERLRDAGIAGSFIYVGSPEREEKLRFLRGIDVFSAPTLYEEPKGLYVLEALASGVPVVQPRHGAFPELVARTGGAVLHPPKSASGLADSLVQLIEDPENRRELGEAGRAGVLEHCGSEVAAAAMLEVYDRF